MAKSGAGSSACQRVPTMRQDPPPPWFTTLATYTREASMANSVGDLDDQFHETGLRGTGSLLVNSSFAVG